MGNVLLGEGSFVYQISVVRHCIGIAEAVDLNHGQA